MFRESFKKPAGFLHIRKPCRPAGNGPFWELRLEAAIKDTEGRRAAIGGRSDH